MEGEDVSVAAYRRVMQMPFPPEHRGAKFLLAHLAFRYWPEEGHAFDTVAELAEETSASERQIYRDLTWLVDHGLLKIKQRRRANGTQTSSSYTFPWLEEDAEQGDVHVSPPAEPTDVHVSQSTPQQTDTSVTRPTDVHVSRPQGSRLTSTSPLSRRPSRHPPSRQPATTKSSPASASASLQHGGPPDDQHAVPSTAPDPHARQHPAGGAPTPAPAELNGKIVALADHLATTGRGPGAADVDAKKREALAWAKLIEEQGLDAARRLRAAGLGPTGHEGGTG